MDLDKTIHERRSIRKFKSNQPDWRDILECIDTIRYAPMAGNNFSLKVILVDEENKIREMAEAAQQPFVSQAKYVVVVCTTPTRTEISFGERGKNYLKQQAGAAIQNFLLKITEKRLATCWIGHFAEEQVKRILNIPEEVHIEALLPVGYAYKKPEPKRRIDLDNFLYFNEYGKKKMNKIRTINV
ncbi:MAG: nitroreductase family protein [Candidatus Diapherotrites archaeon]